MRRSREPMRYQGTLYRPPSEANASPTDALFRTNHASNYLPVGGRLPRDREAMLAVLDAALNGRVPLRPEWSRGL